MILRFLWKALLVVVLVLVLISKAQPCLVPAIRDKTGNVIKVVDVIAGKDVRLTCNVKENGVITSWLKNNKTISPSDHPRMRLKLNKYLKIKKTEKADAGSNTCVAENDCGRNVYSMQLFVGSPTRNPHGNSTPAAPKFTVPPDRLSRNLLALPVGNSVKLDCSADGYPRPTVRWYKDGALFQERKQTQAGSRLYLGPRTLLLNMRDLVPTDSGKYTCNVSNAYGWINHTYYVDVHERVLAEPVVLSMENITVYEGENATLLCKALSDSYPHFQWLRWFLSPSNGSTNSTIEHPHYEVIKQNKQDSNHHLILPQSNDKFDFHGEELTLINVTKKDEGEYTCIVGNAVGYAVEQAYIIVYRQKGKHGSSFLSEISINSEDITSSPAVSRHWEFRKTHEKSPGPKSFQELASKAITSDKREQNVSQKDENATVGMSTVIAHKEEKPGNKSSRASRIQYPEILIGMLVGVVVLAIIASGLCYWQKKKVRASSSTAKSRRPEIDSLRAKYEVQNEYVLVPDYKRSV